MAPTRRNRRAAKSDVGSYHAAAGTRKSARLVELEAAKKSNVDLVVKQEVYEAQPDHPIPFPLILDSYYVCTGPGEFTLKDAKVAKVETTPEETKHVLDALCLVLQAGRALILATMPDSLDSNHDIVWDWHSVELSANEYGAFAYAMVNYPYLKDAMDIVSYDWTPLDSCRGILSVRKKCNFQSQLTRILVDVIVKAMDNNELLRSLVDRVGLEPQTRVSVLMGTVEGVRTPCRCFRFRPKSKSEKARSGEGHLSEDSEGKKEEARPFDGIQDFVLEVGMGEKNQVLRQLAHSYIERGTLCVMAVSMERLGDYDFDWSYSLYRRGEARRFPGQVTRYEVDCTVQDARVKAVEKDVVKFPASLTLFDFVPPSILEKNGVTCRNDEKAVVELRIRPEQLDGMERKLGACLLRGKSMSQHLQDLKELLRK